MHFGWLYMHWSQKWRFKTTASARAGLAHTKLLLALTVVASLITDEPFFHLYHAVHPWQPHPFRDVRAGYEWRQEGSWYTSPIRSFASPFWNSMKTNCCVFVLQCFNVHIIRPRRDILCRSFKVAADVKISAHSFFQICRIFWKRKVTSGAWRETQTGLVQTFGLLAVV